MPHLGRKLLNNILGGDGHQQPLDPHLPGNARILDDERFLSPGGQPGTYPRLTRLSDGSILSAYTHFRGPTRHLLVARSTDNARHFVPWGEVTMGNNDVDNMYLIEVYPPGTIVAAFRNHDIGPAGPMWFRITVCRSQDWGRTWGYLSQAAEKGAPFGVWEPFMRIGRQGELQMTFSQEFAPDDQRTMLVKSFNQGQTWTPPVCVGGDKPDEIHLRDGMTGISRTVDNGRDALVMVFETTRYGPLFNVECMISYDDGASWHCRQQIYVPPHGRSAGSPQIASFADGSMAVTFMTDNTVLIPRWPFNAAVKVCFSGPPQNGQLRWTSPKLVSREHSTWPGIIALDGNTVLVLYDKGGPKGRSITWNK